MRLSLVVAALALALSGCGSAPEPQATAAKTARPDMAGRPSLSGDWMSGARSYRWGGSSFSSGPALMAVVNDRIARHMTLISTPTTNVAALRVLLPLPGGGDAVVAEASRQLDMARIEAIRAVGMFKSVRVELTGRDKFKARGHDYVLLLENGQWRLKNGNGLETVVDDGADLTAFLDNLAAGLDRLQGGGDWAAVLTVGPSGHGVQFQGREYLSMLRLNDAFDTANAELLRKIKPTDKPLGGRALLVIPTMGASDIQLRPGEDLALLDTARQAYRLSLDKRVARFVAASKVFSFVAVEFGNDPEPAQGAFDWVLWRMPDAMSWSARGRDGVVMSVVLPILPDDFAGQLIQAMTPPPPPPAAEPESMPSVGDPVTDAGGEIIIPPLPLPQEPQQ
ncbi:hypothetical protein [Magnetospirillum sulfuroxidans]|uniref:Lipoprotein n=1 Tax=Magnetospirillum sulfuroxidans TaxID=611300 RepID=A0ABS5IGF3_9PROT|nr:hypothetical protein [Magnetospirillum sulfuroxidans]MBR9973511.1 hypothetical protein [Magnetospirillum sulfuroxidans]